MPLRIITRPDTGALTISGTVRLPDGGRVAVRRRAATNERRLAEEEATALETQILRDAWHGERRGNRAWAEAVAGYLNAAERKRGDIAQLRRLTVALGDVRLREVDQAALERVVRRLYPAGITPGTHLRSVIAPVRAVMLYAHRRGWCDAPVFEIPKQPAGRTRYLLPDEAERLIAAAAPHLRPLLIFLLCTGARMSEALELEWRDVDLAGGRAIFWRTKNGRRRFAALPPRAVAALAGLDRGGSDAVFRTGSGVAFTPHNRQGGGQIKTGWRSALRRAGLDPELTPHSCRHSFASWHYALHRDLLALRDAGGWSSVALVERYAHLMNEGQEAAIRAFWGIIAQQARRA